MKPFLTKSFAFVAMFAAYCAAMYGVNALLIENNPPVLPAAEVWIAGDSHTQNGLNPDLFRSALNVSQTAEPYFITYWKLKELLRHNSISHVVLGFAHHNISTYNDRKLDGQERDWTDELFRRTYTIADFAPIANLDIDHLGFWKLKFKHMCLVPNKSHWGYIGEYTPIDHTSITDCEEVIGWQFYHDGNEVDISQTSIDYLHKITELCQSKGIRVTLIATPVHPTYRSRIPSKFLRRFEELRTSFESRGIVAMDLSDGKFEDKHFLDSSHLNEHGARIFSAHVGRELGL